ncbi:uncharacterized protein LTR77_003382 [Saxophila tyrrhenica]|uniref:Uncharacterized protein n=1 Tax=Saxophila tyrrhenica TaxID=1690608 RepID=A0AAV9PGF9_9PEZI|nr:hypothetical protein LTR77_003382 [Saxophila tyrrhenica]
MFAGMIASHAEATKALRGKAGNTLAAAAAATAHTGLSATSTSDIDINTGAIRMDSKRASFSNSPNSGKGSAHGKLGGHDERCLPGLDERWFGAIG